MRWSSLQRDVSAVLVAMGCGQAGADVQPASDGVQDSSGGIVGRARRIRRAARRAIANVDVTPVPLAAEDVGLYRSELLPTGARYTRLVTAPLAGRAPTGH